MKKYLTMLFAILFISSISSISYSGQVFGEEINPITISKISSMLSNPGYISNAGKENIIVEGTAPAGSLITVVLNDSTNLTNSVSNTQAMSVGVTSYRIGLNSQLSFPEALHDGLISVSAYITASTSAFVGLPATATVIKQTAAPTITLIGDNPFYCRIRTTCPDLGATARDSFGNKLLVTVSGNNVRENIAGNYLITYNTVDLAGNEAMATRRVNVSTRTSGLSSTTISAADITETPAATSSSTAVPNVVIVTSTSSPIVESPVIVTTPTLTVTSEVSVIKVSGVANAITKQLRKGVSSAGVRLLQVLLAKDKSIYPEGLTTGFYGNLTVKAVQKFQEKYGIASKGKGGYGEVGPKTKAKLVELYGD